VYLSHISQDESEESPIIFADMENCLDGAEIEYQERTTLKDLIQVAA
jgi:hypothetical protein